MTPFTHLSSLVWLGLKKTVRELKIPPACKAAVRLGNSVDQHVCVPTPSHPTHTHTHTHTTTTSTTILRLQYSIWGLHDEIQAFLR